ncbi:hypothetical protein ACTJKQ_13345 [Acidovorax sp. 22279]|uniref:hypothetical protein n=1 Tax=Acidovorax sp. 22279 TaxID=3453900 RepID=UPI003F82DE7E
MLIKFVKPDPRAGDLVRLDSHRAQQFIDAGSAQRVQEGVAAPGTALRDDGPTVQEFVAAGYLAVNYPPAGYASKSTPEEIAAAVAAVSAPESSLQGESTIAADGAAPAAPAPESPAAQSDAAAPTEAAAPAAAPAVKAPAQRRASTAKK